MALEFFFLKPHAFPHIPFLHLHPLPFLIGLVAIIVISCSFTYTILGQGFCLASSESQEGPTDVDAIHATPAGTKNSHQCRIADERRAAALRGGGLSLLLKSILVFVYDRRHGWTAPGAVSSRAGIVDGLSA